MPPRTTMVVASNRPDSLTQFLRAWDPFPWDRTLLVHDGPEVPRRFDGYRDSRSRPVHNRCWVDIDAVGERGRCFSRQDSAIKAFGFSEVWNNPHFHGTDVVLTLDDDCLPDPEEVKAAGGLHYLVDGYTAALDWWPTWTESVPGVPTRGVPYGPREAGDAHPCLHMGLWSDHPDLDAPQTLARLRGGPGPELEGYRPPAGRRLMHPSQYFPLCGMNLGFRRSATPLLYFPRMGVGSPYGRFDDIWAGVLLQKVARGCGLSASVGGPVVRHSRASRAMDNLVKEAAGIRANECFSRAVDAHVPPERGTVAAHYAALARFLRDRDAGLYRFELPPELPAYINSLGGYMLDWLYLLGFDDQGAPIDGD